MTLRRSLLALAVATIAGLGTLTVPAIAAPTAVRSEPVHSYTDAVRETVWVDTGLTAPDGDRVRVAADIVRPRTAAKVPVIMDASPYYLSRGRGNESQKKTYDNAGRPIRFPLFYDNYFVPRGYAVVLVDLSGTARSNGCVDVGGRAEVASVKAVVDWLNGRATGHTSATGPATAAATWSTGAVGMIGKSWDGTIANGVAATGVEGLKTIVPIGAISSWYDYYRSSGAAFTNGGPASLAAAVENEQGAADCGAVKAALTKGSPSSGDLTPMYRERDYVQAAGKVRASVFVVHGVNDLNVKSINFGQWWAALPPTVERKIWLTQAGHVDPFDFRRPVWVDTLHRWFDHYLLGFDNGIEDEPLSTVEEAPDRWRDDSSWPAGTPLTLRPRPGRSAEVGALGADAPPAGTVAALTDNGSTAYDWITNPAGASSARVVYRTEPLTSDIRVSGTSTITVTATSSAPAARVSAVLVDYGPATIRDYRSTGEGIRTLATRSCWGESTAGDSACYLDTATATTTVTENVIARGWADLGHYAGLDHRRVLAPDTAYTITFTLATTDQVIRAGHRLGLVIGGADTRHITSTGGSPRLTVDLARTALHVPIANTD